jgi:hypothetical protein
MLLISIRHSARYLVERGGSVLYKAPGVSIITLHNKSFIIEKLWKLPYDGAAIYFHKLKYTGIE